MLSKKLMSSSTASEVYSQGIANFPAFTTPHPPSASHSLLIRDVADDSIIPFLNPKGIAATIISSPLKHKILLLNNTPDRETTGFTSATDYVAAIVTACHDSLRASHTPLQAIESGTWNQFVTHVVYLREGKVHVDIAELKKRGIECVGVWAGREGEFEAGVLERVLGGICSGRGGLQRRATVQNWPIAKE